MSRAPVLTHPLSNSEIARRLVAYAQMIEAKGEKNPFKIWAYRRAAQTIAGLRKSMDKLVRSNADVTRYPGIGKGIAGALREIVFSGTLGQLEMLLTAAPPESAAVNEFPALDPRRVARVFKKFRIETVPELKQKLAEGAIAEAFGAGMADHFRNAFRDLTAMLLDDADLLAAEIQRFLMKRCRVTRAEVAGDVRRRVETVSDIEFVVETDDFLATLKRLQGFRSRIELVETTDRDATFQLPASVRLTIHGATPANWGSSLVIATGSARSS